MPMTSHEVTALLPIADQLGQPLGECAGVACGDEQARLPLLDGLSIAPHVGRDDGQPGGEALEHHVGESLFL